MGLWHTNGSPNLGQKTRPYKNHKKKRTWKIIDFSVPADHRIKLGESEKKDKYLGALGVMVIVVGNGHCDTNPNPGRDWLHFT